jgi:hypothetical protein
MKRVSQMALYTLGMVARLRDLPADLEFPEFFSRTAQITLRLRAFISDPDNQKLVPDSVARAKRIWWELEEMYKRSLPARIPNLNSLGGALSAFEASLEDDLRKLPTYIVEPVGAYSSDQLIASADNVFPEDMRAGGVPSQVIEDFKKAGSCLAFDLSTACGFHAFRAADSMIRHYYAHFVGTTPTKKPRDWKAYIIEIGKVLKDPNAPRKPNERTIALLDSIRAMDRNPVIHPELDLDADCHNNVRPLQKCYRVNGDGH